MLIFLLFFALILIPDVQAQTSNNCPYLSITLNHPGFVSGDTIEPSQDYYTLSAGAQPFSPYTLISTQIDVRVDGGTWETIAESIPNCGGVGCPSEVNWNFPEEGFTEIRAIGVAEDGANSADCEVSVNLNVQCPAELPYFDGDSCTVAPENVCLFDFSTNLQPIVGEEQSYTANFEHQQSGRVRIFRGVNQLGTFQPVTGVGSQSITRQTTFTTKGTYEISAKIYDSEDNEILGDQCPASITVNAICQPGFKGPNCDQEMFTCEGGCKFDKVVTGGRDYDPSYGFSCGIEEGTGHVYCWGNNYFGQLGTGEACSNGSRGGHLSHICGETTPQKIAVNYSFIDIALGGDFACGIREDNRIMCWGHNNLGQLGRGSPTLISIPNPTPQLVQNSHTHLASQITAGDLHVCIIRQDNRVSCWGYNNFGSLGLGDTNNRYAPTVINQYAQYLDVDASGTTTCAISSSNNRAYCWGTSGALGIINENSPSSQLSPVQVQDYADCTTLQNENSCQEESSYCEWNDAVPITQCVGGSFTMESASCGSFSEESCNAVSNCAWNYNNQIGNYVCEPIHVEYQCSDFDNNEASCNSLVFQGKCDSFEIDEGTSSCQNIGSYGYPRNLEFNKISTQGSFACAIQKSTAKLYCWSNYNHIQQLIGSNNNFPKLMNNRGDSTTDWNMVVTYANQGNIGYCVRNFGSRVLCYGHNNNGQLGTMLNQSFVQSNGGPKQYTLDSQFKHISVAGSHSCFTRQDGEVFCQGLNYQGALGTGIKFEGVTNTPQQPFCGNFDEAAEEGTSRYQCIDEENRRASLFECADGLCFCESYNEENCPTALSEPYPTAFCSVIPGAEDICEESTDTVPTAIVDFGTTPTVTYTRSPFNIQRNFQWLRNEGEDTVVFSLTENGESICSDYTNNTVSGAYSDTCQRTYTQLGTITLNLSSDYPFLNQSAKTVTSETHELQVIGCQINEFNTPSQALVSQNVNLSAQIEYNSQAHINPVLRKVYQGSPYIHPISSETNNINQNLIEITGQTNFTKPGTHQLRASASGSHQGNFYTCQQIHEVEVTCPTDTVWDEDLQECIQPLHTCQVSFTNNQNPLTILTGTDMNIELRTQWFNNNDNQQLVTTLANETNSICQLNMPTSPQGQSTNKCQLQNLNLGSSTLNLSCDYIEVVNKITNSVTKDVDIYGCKIINPQGNEQAEVFSTNTYSAQLLKNADNPSNFTVSRRQIIGGEFSRFQTINTTTQDDISADVEFNQPGTYEIQFRSSGEHQNAPYTCRETIQVNVSCPPGTGWTGEECLSNFLCEIENRNPAIGDDLMFRGNLEGQTDCYINVGETQINLSTCQTLGFINLTTINEPPRQENITLGYHPQSEFEAGAEYSCGQIYINCPQGTIWNSSQQLCEPLENSCQIILDQIPSTIVEGEPFNLNYSVIHQTLNTSRLELEISQPLNIGFIPITRLIGVISSTGKQDYTSQVTLYEDRLHQITLKVSNERSKQLICQEAIFIDVETKVQECSVNSFNYPQQVTFGQTAQFDVEVDYAGSFQYTNMLQVKADNESTWTTINTNNDLRIIGEYTPAQKGIYQVRTLLELDSENCIHTREFVVDDLAVCGKNQGVYAYTDQNYQSQEDIDFCDAGELISLNYPVQFPQQGQTITWSCQTTIDNKDCFAYRYTDQDNYTLTINALNKTNTLEAQVNITKSTELLNQTLNETTPINLTGSRAANYTITPISQIQNQIFRRFLGDVNCQDTNTCQINMNMMSQRTANLIYSAQDTCPDDIVFQPIIGAQPNQTLESNEVILTGFEGELLLEINPQSHPSTKVSVNKEEFTSESFTVKPGDLIIVQLNSSTDYATQTNSSLNLGCQENIPFNIVTRLSSSDPEDPDPQVCVASIFVTQPQNPKLGDEIELFYAIQSSEIIENIQINANRTQGIQSQNLLNFNQENCQDNCETNTTITGYLSYELGKIGTQYFEEDINININAKVVNEEIQCFEEIIINSNCPQGYEFNQALNMCVEISEPICGENADIFNWSQTNWPDIENGFCEIGNPSQKPQFPQPNQRATWNCQTQTEQTICHAARLDKKTCLNENELNFETVQNAPLNTQIISNTQLITGIEGEITLISTGQNQNLMVSVNNQDFESLPVTVQNQDSIRLKITTPQEYDQTIISAISSSECQTQEYSWTVQTITNEYNTCEFINPTMQVNFLEEVEYEVYFEHIQNAIARVQKEDITEYEQQLFNSGNHEANTTITFNQANQNQTTLTAMLLNNQNQILCQEQIIVNVSSSVIGPSPPDPDDFTCEVAAFSSSSQVTLPSLANFEIEWTTNTPIDNLTLQYLKANQNQWVEFSSIQSTDRLVTTHQFDEPGLYSVRSILNTQSDLECISDEREIIVDNTPLCGQNNQTFEWDQTNYPSTSDEDFCLQGTLLQNPTQIPFPENSQTVSWMCASNTEPSIMCSATREQSQLESNLTVTAVNTTSGEIGNQLNINLDVQRTTIISDTIQITTPQSIINTLNALYQVTPPQTHQGLIFKECISEGNCTTQLEPGQIKQIQLQYASQDTCPDTLNIPNIYFAPLDTQIDSQATTLTGFDGPLTIEIDSTSDSSAQISINRQAFTNTPQTVNPGDELIVRLQSSSNEATPVIAYLNIGCISLAEFKVTTNTSQDACFTDIKLSNNDPLPAELIQATIKAYHSQSPIEFINFTATAMTSNETETLYYFNQQGCTLCQNQNPIEELINYVSGNINSEIYEEPIQLTLRASTLNSPDVCQTNIIINPECPQGQVFDESLNQCLDLSSGVCGTRAQTFSWSQTQWPNPSLYCSEGISSSEPLYPEPGQTVNWNCVGALGQTSCQATRNTRLICPQNIQFQNVTGAQLNQVITSNSATITGIEGQITLSLQGQGNPRISVNGQAFQPGPVTVQNQDVIRIRTTSANDYSQTNLVDLYADECNTKIASWEVKTISSQTGYSCEFTQFQTQINPGEEIYFEANFSYLDNSNLQILKEDELMTNIQTSTNEPGNQIIGTTIMFTQDQTTKTVFARIQNTAGQTLCQEEIQVDVGCDEGEFFFNGQCLPSYCDTEITRTPPSNANINQEYPLESQINWDGSQMELGLFKQYCGFDLNNCGALIPIQETTNSQSHGSQLISAPVQLTQEGYVRISSVGVVNDGVCTDVNLINVCAQGQQILNGQCTNTCTITDLDGPRNVRVGETHSYNATFEWQNVLSTPFSGLFINRFHNSPFATDMADSLQEILILQGNTIFTSANKFSNINGWRITATGSFPNGAFCTDEIIVCPVGWELQGGVCVDITDCDPADPCCNSDGFFIPEEDNFVCSEGSWTCSGSSGDDLCQRERITTMCSGTSAACIGPQITQTQLAPAGEVCNAGEFQALSPTNYCDEGDKYCTSNTELSGEFIGCDGAGQCSSTSQVFVIETYDGVTQFCYIDDAGDGPAQICGVGPTYMCDVAFEESGQGLQDFLNSSYQGNASDWCVSYNPNYYSTEGTVASSACCPVEQFNETFYRENPDNVRIFGN